MRPRRTGISKALPLQLRSRETKVHAIAARILLGWCATATGQTRENVIPRLALLNAWLTDEPGPLPAPQTGLPNQPSPPHPRPRRLTRARLPDGPL